MQMITDATEKYNYFVEMTDTYGGEANYGWVHRFLVSAKSFQGAISKVTKETGYHARKRMDCGEMAEYRVPGACIVYFVTWATGEEHRQYSHVKFL
jgi:hypothetical protein